VEAMTLADKIVVLRAGIVEQVGAPLDLYDNPDNMFVAGFIGSPRMNFLKARVISAEAGHITISLANQPAVKLSLALASTKVRSGDEISLGIRPEHFRAAGEGDADMVVDIDVAEHLGNTSDVYAHVSPEERIIIEREDSRAVANRDKLTVGISAATSFLFDKDGKRIR
jgi:lactose/L-arabinose transport system ATP-binding protein